MDLSKYWSGNKYANGQSPNANYCDQGVKYYIDNGIYRKISSSSKNDIAIPNVPCAGNGYKSAGIRFCDINGYDAYPMPFIYRLADVVYSIYYYLKKDYSTRGVRGVVILDSGRGRGFRPPTIAINSYDSSGKFNDNHKWGGALDMTFVDNNGQYYDAIDVVKCAAKHKLPCTCLVCYGKYNQTVHIAGGAKSSTWCWYGWEDETKGKRYMDGTATPISQFYTDYNVKVSNETGLVTYNSTTQNISIGNSADGIQINWSQSIATGDVAALAKATTVNDSAYLDYRTLGAQAYKIKSGFAVNPICQTEKETVGNITYDKNLYYLRVASPKDSQGKATLTEGFVLNSTAADASMMIQEMQPYLFKYSYKNSPNFLYGKITGASEGVYTEFTDMKGVTHTDPAWFEEQKQKNTYFINQDPADNKTNGRIFEYDSTSKRLQYTDSVLPLQGLYIYNKNPMYKEDKSPSYILERLPIISTDGAKTWKQGLLPDTYYVIKVDKTIINPHFGFLVNTSKQTDNLVDFKDFTFHPLNGKSSDSEQLSYTAEENDVFLLTNLPNGSFFSAKSCKDENGNFDTSYCGKIIDRSGNFTTDTNQVVDLIDIVTKTNDSISAYTKQKTKYFYRNNYKTIYDNVTGELTEICINENAEDEITYIDLDKDVISAAIKPTKGSSKISEDRSISIFDKKDLEFKYYCEDALPKFEDEQITFNKVEKIYGIYTYTHGVTEMLEDIRIVTGDIAQRKADLESIGKTLSEEEQTALDKLISLFNEFNNKRITHTISEAVTQILEQEHILEEGVPADNEEYKYVWSQELNITSITPTATAANLPEDDFLSPGDIFYLPAVDRYFQYYRIEAKDTQGNVGRGGDWAYAFLGDGYNDKRRTLIASKSNRFNLIQQLAELFKCWPVFDIKRNENGQLEKRIWFRESCLRDNFAGFHKGVNVSSVSRKEQSEGIVTKMYVEDVDSNYSKDGFITIRNAKHNPFGENFLYNFRYYIEQHLIDVKDSDGKLLIEKELEHLYRTVGLLNIRIRYINELAIALKLSLNQYNASITSLRYYVAGKNEEITKLQTYLNEEVQSLTANKRDTYTQKLLVTTTERDAYQEELDIQENNRKLDQEEYDGYVYEINALQAAKQKRIEEFEQKYIDYIKEGTWSDNSYSDNDTYFLDAQKVSNTSAIPNATWTINVLDGECYEQLKDFHFKVGDKTFLVDKDFFKKPGPTGEYKFEILISSIKEYLDNPSKSTYEVRNYATSFDDLFHRISAATQTLQLKEQVFDRGANFTSNGQIEESVIQDTLTSNPLTLTKNANEAYTLDETGLELHSILNPTKKTKVTSDGIFLANSRTSDGNVNWRLGITADGINADNITAGEIDAGTIRIKNSNQVGLEMDELGFTAYNIPENDEDGESAGESYGFTRMDKYGLYHVDENYGTPFKNKIFNNLPQSWDVGLTKKGAIDIIQKNADFSLTEKGLLLNMGQSDIKEVKEINIVDKEEITYKQTNGVEVKALTYKVDSSETLVGNVFYVAKEDSDLMIQDNLIYARLPNIDPSDDNYKNKFLYVYTNAENFIRLGSNPYQGEDGFGLYINSDNQPIVELQNNGINRIGNWRIQQEGLYCYKDDSNVPYAGIVSKNGAYTDVTLEETGERIHLAFFAGNEEGAKRPKFFVSEDGRMYVNDTIAIGPDGETASLTNTEERLTILENRTDGFLGDGEHKGSIKTFVESFFPSILEDFKIQKMSISREFAATIDIPYKHVKFHIEGECESAGKKIAINFPISEDYYNIFEINEY